MNERKQHFIFISLLALLTILFLGGTWFNLSSHMLGDLVTFYYPMTEFLKQSITDYNNYFPLWNPMRFAGEPQFGKSSFLNMFYLPGPLLILLPTLAALKLTIVLDFFLAGLTMYLLAHYITKKPHLAFISALVYMFNGYFIFTTVFAEWIDFANAYHLIPLVMLFSMKAFKEKETILYAVLAGIALAFMIIGSSGTVFLYQTLMLLVYFGIMALGKNLPERIKKAFLIGIILLIVFAGLSAFKLFPTYEYQKEYGVRNELTWEQASGRSVAPSEFFRELIEPSSPLAQQTQSAKIGIIAALLSIIAIYKYPKNRHVIFLVILMIISLLLASASFLLHFLYEHYPGWSGMRYANRAFLLFVFSASILAGMGAGALFDSLKKKFPDRVIKLAYIVVVILLLLNLAVFSVGGKGNYSTQPQNLQKTIAANEVMQFMANQPGIFRIHAFETNGIDWGTEFYTTSLKLENIYTYDTNWHPDYVNGYLSMASLSFAKFWGVLNVKYVTSMVEREEDGLVQVNKFGNCTICYPEQPAIQKAWGPYLYENKYFMPRAYLINNSILVIGEKEGATEAIYTIMTLDVFYPNTSVIILGKKSLELYTDEELARHNNIMLTEEPTLSDLAKLKNYKGNIFPDVFKGEKNFRASRIREALSKGEYIPVPDENFQINNFENHAIKIPAYKGYLVISEKYAVYNGWQAIADGKEKELMIANGIITAIQVDGEKSVNFSYYPDSFKIGKIISILTLVLLILFFINRKFNIIKLKKTENAESIGKL